MLVKVTPRQPSTLENTPLMVVTTPAELDQMMKELEVTTEIAVDLEHHSFRTFLGLTCLIQISTREKDYIIDALTLRDDLEVLNDIFTRPKIVKVGIESLSLFCSARISICTKKVLIYCIALM